MRINIVYSTQHWIMPRILITIIIALGLLIFILEGRERVKAGGSFFPKFQGKFFAENYDKLKFWGTIVLMAAYFFLLEIVGFTVCSIVFLFLFNTLFAGPERMKDMRYHRNSLIISFSSVLLISILFGTVFAITLPSGFATIEIPAWNFILY